MKLLNYISLILFLVSCISLSATAQETTRGEVPKSSEKAATKEEKQAFSEWEKERMELKSDLDMQMEQLQHDISDLQTKIKKGLDDEHYTPQHIPEEDMDKLIDYEGTLKDDLKYQLNNSSASDWPTTKMKIRKQMRKIERSTEKLVDKVNRQLDKPDEKSPKQK